MTMKSRLDPYATEVLKPVAPATEKLNAVPQATEKLAPVVPNTPAVLPHTPAVPTPPVTEQRNPVLAAIPAQRQDSGPAARPAQTFVSAPAPGAPHRSPWEHLPTERHPGEPAPQRSPARQPAQPALKPPSRQAAAGQPEPHSEGHPQSRLRAAQLLVQRTTDLRAVTKSAAGDRDSSDTPRPGETRRPGQEAAAKQEVAPKAPTAPKQRWQRSAVTVAPAQGTLAAAGFAACDYLIRTVSVLGLLAVVGMATAGTAKHQVPNPAQGRTPSTTVATAPAHPGSFSSTRHHD